MKLRSFLEAYGLRTAYALGMSGLLAIHLPPPLNLISVGGLLVLSLAAGVIIHLQLKQEGLPGDKRLPGERLVWITTLLGVAGVQLVRRAMGASAGEDVTAAPALLLAATPLIAQGLLIGGLVSAPMASTTVTLGALLLAVAGVVPLPTLAVGWLLGIGGAWLITPLKRRSDLTRTAGILAALGAVIGFTVSFIGTAPTGISLVKAAESSLWGGVACVVAVSIFWFGATVLEKLVGLTSDWTLLELCSPDHPLIQELCMKAPGTYAHSVMVGNLAESAARRVGASAVICRAMAIFHDVGKMVHPSYFIENQRGENIHDCLDPAISAQAIIDHVHDGVELARQHRLPKVIVDGIAQHHGTSLMAPFFIKARATMADLAHESMFRYPGPRPQTREAAILHLADSVEAASRCLGPADSPGELIDRLFRRSLDDGQLDECDLTLKDLHAIQASFLESLDAMRHDRISYPVTTAKLDDKEEPDDQGGLGQPVGTAAPR